MRKLYSAPRMHLQNVQLGVFGDYNGGPDGSDIEITPVKVVERFNMRMD